MFAALGTGIPKVVELTVDGELVEGNILRGSAKVVWCGGTPGKGVSRLVAYVILLLFLGKCYGDTAKDTVGISPYKINLTFCNML